MNPYQSTKSVKLQFISESSNKQILFGFNKDFQNFQVYICKIPLKLPKKFLKEFTNWFNCQKKIPILILVEEYEENYFKIITSNRDIGFQKFLIAGIVYFINTNHDEIFDIKNEKIENEFFDIRMYKYNEDFITNDILSAKPEGIEDYKIIDFIKSIKYKSPKAKYLKFHFIGNDSKMEDIYFDMDVIADFETTKNDKDIFAKICDIFDKLFNYEEERNTTFEVYIQIPKDPNIIKLIEDNKDIRESIKIDIDIDIWQNFLIAIGRFGISRIINGTYFEDFISIFKKIMGECEFRNKFEHTKNCQIMIKTMYKYMNEIYGISNENFNVFINTVLNCNDKFENFILKRGHFTVRANNFLNKIKSNTTTKVKKQELIKKFIKINGVYFSRKQLEEPTSFEYVEQILSIFNNL